MIGRENKAAGTCPPMIDGAVSAIAARGLSKYYGHRAVLRQIDFSVGRGQTVLIRGANGAGKTTLLRCLATSVQPSAGEVRWFDQPARGHPSLRRWIGVVAHESRLYRHLTLLENLVFAARVLGVHEPHRQARQYLELTGMWEHGHRMPSQVSRGMRQRVAVARALIHEPPILLLDEPFSSLDRESRQRMWQQLTRLGDAGRTIVLVTHDEEIAAGSVDRVLELRAGRIVADSGLEIEKAA